MSKSIVSSIKSIFNIDLTDKEVDFICSYLVIANQVVNNVHVSILVVCHGEKTATDMVQLVTSSYQEDITIAAINYHNTMTLKELLEFSKEKAVEINQGPGVLILVDMEPLTSIGTYIFKETQILCKTIANITLKGLLSIAEDVISGASLQSFNQYTCINENAAEKRNTISNSNFINRLINEFLSETLIFINPRKACDYLMVALEGILKDLSIELTNEITVKFLSHCIHMLERSIKGEPLSYPKIKNFINENQELTLIVEKHMNVVANKYDIVISPEEIAYIVEIFLLFTQ